MKKALFAIAVAGSVFAFASISAQASENGTGQDSVSRNAGANQSASRPHESAAGHRQGGGFGGRALQGMAGAMAAGGFQGEGGYGGYGSDDRLGAGDYRSPQRFDRYGEMRDALAGQAGGYEAQDISRLARGAQGNGTELRQMMRAAHSMGIDPRDFANEGWRD